MDMDRTFSMPSIKLVNSSLSSRHQRVTIYKSQSLWKVIKYDLPKGYVLGPVLFNIFLCDLYFTIDDVDVASYADDNTLYTHTVKF